MPTEVFVCHSANDTAVAEKIVTFLEAQKIPCWIAPRNVRLGDDSGESILNAIHACSIVVLVFSGSANESASVKREVECAVRAEKVLIPFRIENVAPTGALETYFRHRYLQEAYMGPLEKPLEELAKVLKPLVHQRKVMTTEDASISRTLPSRASILRGSNVKSSEMNQKPLGPLQVSLNFNRLLRAGRASSCECLIENSGSSSLEQVEILLESRGLKRDIRQDLGEPLLSGDFPLKATVIWTAEGRRFSMAGTRPLLINEAPGATNLVRPTQNTPAPQERALQSGVDSDPLSIDELPENFEPLDLELVYDVDTKALEVAGLARSLTIPEIFLRQVQLGMRLKLEPMEAKADLPFQDIRLVARPGFSLGRSQEDSDLVLWFWPRNEIHDTKTRRISKKHCTLTSDKGKIQVKNSAAASLTTFDGQDLTGSEGVLLERRGTLNLSGIYLVEITRFPARFPQGPTISNLQEWRRKNPTGAIAPPVGGSVRFTSLTSNTLPQNSTWMLTDATLGTSRVNPIVLEIDGLSEIQVRFHHFLGAFWLENLIDNGAVGLEGEPLVPGSIVPLTTGLHIRLGSTSFYLSVTD
jgi:hypothetical protein